MPKRKVAKTRKIETRKIKTVKLTPNTAVSIAVPKGVAPSVITDPATGDLHIIPIPANKLAEPGWFKRWFG